MKSSCKELKELRPYNEGLGGDREGTLFHAFQSHWISESCNVPDRAHSVIRLLNPPLISQVVFGKIDLSGTWEDVSGAARWSVTPPRPAPLGVKLLHFLNRQIRRSSWWKSDQDIFVHEVTQHQRNLRYDRLKAIAQNRLHEALQ